MEEEIIREIVKECNWWERKVINLFSKIIVKVYRRGMVDSFNYFNK